ncbi:acid protease [Byssothecium circinans]|uniref:Acid protease n=1 Tax=Byssothecium circinans TaxID=147558 RepID=A0A6A5U7Y9_9PLEO|nr:acid protease [Byssothecium circinans]
MAAVTIGDSKEEYKLLLDSAASNTWVMSEDCSTEACGKHNLFGKSDSKTIKTDPKTFSITYGTGFVSGTTATDTIHIGTSLSTSLTFGIATNVSSDFLQYPMDGIMGLSRGTSTSGNGTPLIVEALANAKLISSKLYGLHLGRAKDGKNDGELNLGEVNKERFSGDLNWIDSVKSDRGFWEVPVADIGFGGKTIGLKAGDKTGIIDTGTSFFYMPPTEASALHKLIEGSSQDGENFQVPCSTTSPITLKFGSVTYNMSATDWVGDKNEDSGLCNSKIIGRKTFQENQWLVGDAFLKNVYTAFDYEKGRVGFGVKSGNATQQSATSSSSASPSAPSGSSGTSTLILVTDSSSTPFPVTTRTTSSSASAAALPTVIYSPSPFLPSSASAPLTNPSSPPGPGSGSTTGNSPAATSGTGSSGPTPAGSGAVAAVPASAFALSVAFGFFAVFV